MTVFVENVLQLLKKQKMTLRGLSAKVGINSSQLSKYTSGKCEPSLKNALIIANFFGCSLDYLNGLDYAPNRFGTLGNEDVYKFCSRLDKLIQTRKTNINRISINIKVTRNAIYSWTEKKVFPKLSILRNLAVELKTTIEYLIGRTDI